MYTCMLKCVALPMTLLLSLRVAMGDQDPQALALNRVADVSRVCLGDWAS